MSKKYLYHVTDTKRFQQILKDGIKANKGVIFVFNERAAAASIALLQCGLEEYALLKIDPEGILAELIPDKVGESTAKYQFYIKQDLIAPEFVHFLNCYKISQKQL